MKGRILSSYRHFEQFIVFVLLVLLMIVVLYATIGFVWTIVMGMIEKLHTKEFHVTLPILHDVFAGFLMILIGLELMKTIAMYLDERIIHVEVVFSVAMIAVARHVIDVDYQSAQPLSMIGMGAIIIALAVGYYYFRRAELLSRIKGRASQPFEHEQALAGVTESIRAGTH